MVGEARRRSWGYRGVFGKRDVRSLRVRGFTSGRIQDLKIEGKLRGLAFKGVKVPGSSLNDQQWFFSLRMVRAQSLSFLSFAPDK